MQASPCEERLPWLGRGSRACRGCAGWSATGSTRRSRSSSPRRMRAGASRVRSSSATTARVSAPVFLPAVLAGVTATGRDVLLRRRGRHAHVGDPGPRPRGGRGDPDLGVAQPAPVQRPEVLPARGAWSSARRKAGPMLDRWQTQEFGWAAWDGLGQVRTLEDPDDVHLQRVLEIVDVEAIRRRAFVGRARRLPRRRGPAGGGAAPRTGLQADRPGRRAGRPLRPSARADRGEPADLLGDRAGRRARRSGFAQDPDADRLAIVDETGRYIGEELTLALAASRRLDQAKGPVVLNLSTSQRHRGRSPAGSAARCIRTPVGEINVVERMRAEAAVLGRRGERRRDRPPRRVRPRQLRRRWPWCST